MLRFATLSRHLTILNYIKLSIREFLAQVGSCVFVFVYLELSSSVKHFHCFQFDSHFFHCIRFKKFPLKTLIWWIIVLFSEFLEYSLNYFDLAEIKMYQSDCLVNIMCVKVIPCSAPLKGCYHLSYFWCVCFVLVIFCLQYYCSGKPVWTF